MIQIDNNHLIGNTCLTVLYQKECILFYIESDKGNLVKRLIIE